MNHPNTAGIHWTLDELVFDSQGPGIAIALFTRNKGTETAMGYRWCTNQTYFEKDSEWILLPMEFAVDAAKRLSIKRAAGMKGIQEEGFRKMIAFIMHHEENLEGISY
jgi:hypothetical protein